MRKLSLFLLSIFLGVLLSPLGFAMEFPENAFCKIDQTPIAMTMDSGYIAKAYQERLKEEGLSEQTDENGEETGNIVEGEGEDQKIVSSKEDMLRKILNEQLILLEEEYVKHLITDETAEKCGEENEYTGFIEKADCTKAGKVITEVVEVFASDVEDLDGNKVKTVYSGLCCMVYEETDSGEFECSDTRTIYTETYSSCNDNALFCEKRQWVIGVSGAGIIKVYVKQIYTWGAGIAGFIAVAVIVVSGIQIQLSGVSGDITQSKQRILQSLAGLAFIFLSGILLYTINPNFFS